MVNGIDIFREHFNHFKEQYTVIGGFACDLLMNDAGLDFRQTVDIDMVLIVEALTTDFAKAFWAFIEAGGYQARQRSNGQPEFYRFVDPTNPAYPKMIELFSRPQSNVVLQPDTHLMPLHIDDEVSSLSAILLNDDYYHFLLDGRTVTDGISILDLVRLCFSPTLPSLRRIQFCIAPTSEPLAPVRRTAQSCRAACLSVPGQTLRCIFCTHSGSSHLRFCVRGLLLRSSGRTSGRFSILFSILSHLVLSV